MSAITPQWLLSAGFSLSGVNTYVIDTDTLNYLMVITGTPAKCYFGQKVWGKGRCIQIQHIAKCQDDINGIYRALTGKELKSGV